MARKYKLNKVELTRMRREMKTFQQFLPVLKLKQEQLQAEQLKIRRELQARRAAIAKLQSGWDSVIPLLAESTLVSVARLTRAENLRLGSKTVAGVTVPTLVSVSFPSVAVSVFGTQAWLSRALPKLRQFVRLHTELQVIEKQFDLVDQELRRTTQKVNLFELVLIPEAKEAIRRIKIALGDLQVAAVARAKIAKGKATARDDKSRLASAQGAM
ncbi:MAG: V-type ATP synthase subunit D [Myxococcales bacterium]|nr:V-type ATP synthase subunit D [Myxococcales bacterium]